MIGLSQTPKASILPEPLQQEGLVVYYATGTKTVSGRSLTTPLSSNEFFALPLQRLSTGEFLIYPLGSFKNTSGEERFFIELDRESALTELEASASTQHLMLSDYLKFHPQDKILFIDLADRDPAKFQGLRDILLKSLRPEQIVFTSAYVEPLDFLRKEIPRALFAMNVAQVGKLVFMNSLFIETIAPMDGDLVIAPTKYRKRPLFQPRLVDELNRRQIPILIINPDESPSDNLRGQVKGSVINPYYGIKN
tara:strand:+ start:74822 stop:75574 length:753 start_codon:yes stop_codon:yes gene_type:complete